MYSLLQLCLDVSCCNHCLRSCSCNQSVVVSDLCLNTKPPDIVHMLALESSMSSIEAIALPTHYSFKLS